MHEFHFIFCSLQGCAHSPILKQISPVSSIEHPGLEVFGKLPCIKICWTNKNSLRWLGWSNDKKEFVDWWEVCLSASSLWRGFKSLLCVHSYGSFFSHRTNTVYVLGYGSLFMLYIWWWLEGENWNGQCSRKELEREVSSAWSSDKSWGKQKGWKVSSYSFRG